MMNKEKDNALDEELQKIETEFDDLNDESKPAVVQKIGEAVDTAKDLVEKGAEIVNDAAKATLEFADGQIKNAKKVFDRINDNFGEWKYNNDKEKYKPIFEDSLNDGSITLPEMINVVDFDKRMGIEACKGAIGFRDNVKGVNVVGIYKDDINKYNISFYPKKAVAIYYVNPVDKNMYINMNEYFSYLKEARVAELKKIAQALGAKHFRVSIKEEKTTEISKKVNGKAGIGVARDKGDAQLKDENSEKKYEFIGIASESYYDNTGKEPERPELKFWANSIPINNLIEQRLSKDIPLTSETYKLDYNVLTGIDESQASKISGALKALKFEGSGSICAKAREESKKQFEYLIEF